MTTLLTWRQSMRMRMDKSVARAAAVVVLTAVAACSSGSTGAVPTTEGDRSDTTRKPEGPPGTIVTVIGSGQFGDAGVGGPATEAELMTPIDLAFDEAGNLYIAERHNNRIVKVDEAGALTAVAGGDEVGFSGDGGPAAKAQLNSASGVAVDAEGNLYIADSFNNRIRMVDRRGVITTVAGTGEAGYSGDGGPATEAALSAPAGMVFDADGNLYIADLGNFRIRMIDREGTITTVAGTGEMGFSPERTSATKARLGHPDDHLPMGLAFDAAGALYFTDYGNARVRMIDAKGRVRTVAGNGDLLPSGDGGAATEAGLNGPLDVAIDRNGLLYIATHDHGLGTGQRIRMVDQDGIITTIAGTGESGYSGDGGPALEAELNIPSAVAIGPDGKLYIADALNNVIRMVVL